MRSHLTTLHNRILRAGLRSVCRYRVVACGLDHRGRIIGISTNSPRLPNRGLHAEESLLWKSPRSLRKILIARVGATGEFLAIDPCSHCRKLADKRDVKIERWKP